MKNTYEITFGFWKEIKFGYFEIADLEKETRKYIIAKRIIKAETKQKAERILKHNWAKKIDIKQTREIKQSKEQER